MMTVTLRPGRPDDQSQLLAIVWATIMATERDRDALLARPELVQVPVEQLTAKTCVVAEMGDESVGFAIVLPRPDGDAELDGLFVLPEYQRLGIGRTLVAEVARLALASHAKVLHVISGEDAVSFYRSVGFIQTGMAPTDLNPAPKLELLLLP